jgi:hypothetical protein|tara:strand:+ start:3611 stop:4042 length:432 start_codon:yes stop_codon:yes gene_type:complete
MSQNSEPDWDSINRGKVRHFFALELYKYKLDTEGYSMSLKPSEKGIIDMFVSYVMDGDDEKDESISERLMSEKECGAIIIGDSGKKITAEEHTRAVIHLEARGLKDSDLNKVLDALDDGRIKQDNLTASVDKIREIKSNYNKE